MEKKKGFFTKALDVIERVGNKLPDPFVLFIGLAFFMILLSFVFSLFGATVAHPGTGEELQIRNLLSGEGLQFILTSMLENFTGFAPLGLVLAMMLGIGLAEKVGLLDYAIRKTILKSPPFLLTYTVVFTGILGNLASDAAVVLIPPLGALVFYKVGRHPLAGLAAGFAGAGAGFTANLFIAGTDALLAGISTEAVAIIDDTITVTPVDNWYFNIVSVFLLTFVGGLLTSKFVEPRLGEYKGEAVEEEDTEELPNAKKGFITALITGVLYWAIIVVVIMLPDSPLRGEGGTIIPSPFIDGIVPLILIFFVLIGLAFGLVTGKIKSGKDMTRYMTESISDMAGYIVLVFAIAQFIAYFNWSNLGTWVAVNGAEFLQEVEFTGFGLIMGYIIFTSLMNFLITSGSAKWAIEAPIFIPMFLQLGYDPAFTQVAYRIADSSVNIITPLFPYMVIILAFMQRYDKNASIGTYISLMLPYSIAFLVAWIILLAVFYFTGLPYGPGAYTFFEDRP
ncbi:AbgT family transporter [Salinicoccus roseus]|uniref:AbgT family transporter n=1 Tax=Salinicoccus roseus TaxID=45670 RepID=UPI00230044FC|nr:AbgT family transporter [Salinicoccus roseus]